MHMDTALRARLLDKTLPINARFIIMHKYPAYVDEGVKMLLESYRNGSDDDAGRIACSMAVWAQLSAHAIFDIISTCKRQLGSGALRVLVEPVRRAIRDTSTFAEFIRDYFRFNLPVRPLYTVIDARITREYGSPQRRIYILNTLFNCSNNRGLIFENKAKGEKLLVHVSKHLLKLYGGNEYQDDPGCNGTSRFFDLNSTSNRLRLYLPYIRAMTEPCRYIVTSGIRRDMRTRGAWADYMDEYIELFDIYISSRPHFIANNMREFLNDPQNVHRIKIEDDVLARLNALAEQYIERTDSLQPLYQKPELRAALGAIDSCPSDFEGKTLKQWLRIIFLWAKDGGHLDILEQELQDMTGMCSSGHFRRLINVTNGILFTLNESVNDARRLEFASKIQAIIQAQPDADEILADFPAKALKYANMVVEEMLTGDIPVDRWDEILTVRYVYLYPN